MMFTRIRYKSMFLAMKYITPTLHQRLIELDIDGKGLNIPAINPVAKLPRPSTVFMKSYFKTDNLVGVEIGVNRGDNSKSLLKELPIKKLYLVDIWNDLLIYNYNYARVFNLDIAYKKALKRFKNNAKTEIIKELSENAVSHFKDNSLDFCYIDANHEYSSVYQDIELWYPKVKNSGVVAGHDITNWKQVLQAVQDWCKVNNIKFIVNPPDWYFIKKMD